MRLHDNLVKNFAVTGGKTDIGMVDLILEKPSLALYGSEEKYDTIYKKAACILEGFCRGHAFRDGNKRIALLSAHAFLRVNNHHLVIPLNSAEFLVGIARNPAETEDEIDQLLDEIAEWLQDRTASDKKQYEKLVKRHITYPILGLVLVSLTGVGLFYSLHIVNKWSAAKFHPEYRKSFLEMIKLLFNVMGDSNKVIKMSWGYRPARHKSE